MGKISGNACLLVKLKLTPPSHRIFNDPTHSDLTVRCTTDTEDEAHGPTATGYVQFHVHKTIVCHESIYFQKACTVDMLEKASGVIHIHEQLPSTIHAMLLFMYSGIQTRLPILPQGDALHIESRPPNIVRAAHLYTAGEIFTVPALKDAAARSFHDHATQLWILHKRLRTFQLGLPGSSKTLQLENRKTLEEKRVGYLQRAADAKELREVFWEAAEVAFGDTVESDRAIRDVVVGTLWKFEEDAMPLWLLKGCPCRRWAPLELLKALRDWPLLGMMILGRHQVERAGRCICAVCQVVRAVDDGERFEAEDGVERVHVDHSEDLDVYDCGLYGKGHVHGK